MRGSEMPVKEQVLYTEKDIKKRVSELAKQISEDYDGKEITGVGVLKGSFIFMADLVREITVPLTCSFVQVYTREGEEGSLVSKNILYIYKFNITGKDVLLISEIIDTGVTLSYLVNHLKEMKPNSLKLCILLDKPARRKVNMKADYVGFTIPNHNVFGYGLDNKERARDLPYISFYKE